MVHWNKEGFKVGLYIDFGSFFVFSGLPVHGESAIETLITIK